MIQEMFKGTREGQRRGRLRGAAQPVQHGRALRLVARCPTASAASATYVIFFTLGPLLYVALPYAGPDRQRGAVRGGCAALILTMYGGGFATIPAYLADMFGTQYVGAIHGRLLTAWSAAGVAGPVLVNYIREYQIDRGVPAAQAYNFTMYLMAGLLVAGLLRQPGGPPGATIGTTCPTTSWPGSGRLAVAGSRA